MRARASAAISARRIASNRSSSARRAAAAATSAARTRAFSSSLRCRFALGGHGERRPTGRRAPYPTATSPRRAPAAFAAARRSAAAAASASASTPDNAASFAAATMSATELRRSSVATVEIDIRRDASTPPTPSLEHRFEQHRHAEGGGGARRLRTP